MTAFDADSTLPPTEPIDLRELFAAEAGAAAGQH
ncbi:hypothetical protein BJ979_003406 [Schumannella luteola]|uniref:Uncharacterized protein n=1 Tax=Schumannella luteola TaxID=472059 RepID=A0A852YHM9_9MICO|nr:hypothetical protein [Schumannella luteola]